LPIDTLAIDYDGDGQDDLVTTDSSLPLTHTFASPGLYRARIRVTDHEAGVHEAHHAVLVENAFAMDALFQAIWTGMNTALVSGDTSTAATFLTRRARDYYGPAWNVMLPHMFSIIESYSPLRGFTVGPDVAEYWLTRTIQGESRLFFVYFVRDVDGVWRLEAM
jgi:hypothetical protein